MLLKSGKKIFRLYQLFHNSLSGNYLQIFKVNFAPHISCSWKENDKLEISVFYITVAFRIKVPM